MSTTPITVRAAATGHGSHIPPWLGLLCAGLFVLHAANYLYFFVDDEAIPYVFAQNLLNGNGLRYNSFEGRVEGYSDFLHVIVAATILTAVRLLDLPKFAVFEVNTVWSLVCGMAITWVTFGMLRRLPGIRAPGALAGMSFLVLSGPLAVWSCSSLETAPFALLVTLLVSWTMLPPEHRPPDWLLAGCATAAVLTRIDGFVHVGIVIGCALLVADRSRRRELLFRVVVPCVVVFATYHLWRFWYFGHVVPSPIATKVLYKLHAHAGLLVKGPPENYTRAFLALYGAAPFVALCGAGFFWSRARSIAACGAAAAALTAYLAAVGDWMFGFRFFLPMLPLFALLVAHSVSAVTHRWRAAAGWLLAVGCVLWFAGVAARFFQTYARLHHTESWLLHPTLDPHLHFARYYALLEQSRPLMRRGERTAYNQAGFVPFMLDLDNIDNLGLCSRFFADMPTTDVYMTEVGRFEPPTNRPVHRAGEAYLLYREPKFLMYPSDLVRNANDNVLPAELLGGYYRFLFLDSVERNVVYVRTDRSVKAFRTEPRRFLENLAHVSHIRQAIVNGGSVARQSVHRAFPWLREGMARITVAGRYSADMTFAESDEAVYEVHVDMLQASQPLTVQVSLQDSSGVVAYAGAVVLEANRAQGLHALLPQAVYARRLHVEATTAGGGSARLSISDLRVQGQTRALATYIHRTLRFPAP